MDAVEVGRRGKLGQFRTPAAKARFEKAYDAALALWPLPPTAIDVPTRFGTTRVNACGTSTATPIVMLPALLATSASWAQNVSALAAHRPVYAIDTVCDAGLSVHERPISKDGGGANDFASWLDDVLAGLGIDRSHFVGLSYGGWLCMNQALRSPRTVASITVVEPPGVITRGKVLFALRFGWAGVRRTDRAFDRLIQLMAAEEPPPEPLVEVLRCGFHDFKIAQPFAPLLTDEQLLSIDRPALLLFGEQSPMSDSTKAIDRARRLMPDVRAELVPRTAHVPPLERPEAFNDRVLEFLREVD